MGLNSTGIPAHRSRCYPNRPQQAYGNASVNTVKPALRYSGNRTGKQPERTQTNHHGHCIRDRTRTINAVACSSTINDDSRYRPRRQANEKISLAAVPHGMTGCLAWRTTHHHPVRGDRQRRDARHPGRCRLRDGIQPASSLHLPGGNAGQHTPIRRVSGRTPSGSTVHSAQR